MDEKDVPARLFQAQLLTQRNATMKPDGSDHAADMLEAQGATVGEQWAYYLYLTTLIHRDPQYTLQMAEQVEQIYRYDRTAGVWHGCCCICRRNTIVQPPGNGCS